LTCRKRKKHKLGRGGVFPALLSRKEKKKKHHGGDVKVARKKKSARREVLELRKEMTGEGTDPLQGGENDREGKKLWATEGIPGRKGFQG